MAAGRSKDESEPSPDFWAQVAADLSPLSALEFYAAARATSQNPNTWREELATKILVRAINALEDNVRQKRGKAETEVIRTKVKRHRRGGLSALALAVELLTPKKRGRKKARQAAKAIGRPREMSYEELLVRYQYGADLLKIKGKAPKDVSALLEYILSLGLGEISRHDARKLATKWAKRLPRARKGRNKLPKSPETPR